MKLNTERLLLRPISIVDLYDLYQLQSNEKVAQYNTIGIPDDVNFTQTLIENAVNDSTSFNKTNFWWGVIFIADNILRFDYMKYKNL